MKKLVVFDLDGTLAPSKSAIDQEMAALIDQLLGLMKVAVISGAAWPQFQKQVLSHLAANEPSRISPSFLHVELNSTSSSMRGRSFMLKISQVKIER